MQTEISHLKEVSDLHKRRVGDMMSSMLKDLGEIGSSLGNTDHVSTAARGREQLRIFGAKKLHFSLAEEKAEKSYEISVWADQTFAWSFSLFKNTECRKLPND